MYYSKFLAWNLNFAILTGSITAKNPPFYEIGTTREHRRASEASLHFVLKI